MNIKMDRIAQEVDEQGLRKLREIAYSIYGEGSSIRHIHSPLVRVFWLAEVELN